MLGIFILLYIFATIISLACDHEKYNIPPRLYFMWSGIPLLNFILVFFIVCEFCCKYQSETTTAAQPQETFVFNTGSVKINGQKVVRTVKFSEVPKNSYVIVDNVKTGSCISDGDLLFKDLRGYCVDVTTGSVYPTDDNINERIVKFADVELNFAPVKEEV